MLVNVVLLFMVNFSEQAVEKVNIQTHFSLSYGSLQHDHLRYSSYAAAPGRVNLYLNSRKIIPLFSKIIAIG